MKMRALLAGLSLVASGLPALEWQVDSASVLQLSNIPSPPTIIQEELMGKLFVPFDLKGGGFDVSAHAWVGYPTTAAADIDTLNFHMVFDKPGPDLKSLKWTVGRYAAAEPTGLILNHPLDGSALDFDFGPFGIKLTTGYTGLVMKSSSTIVLSRNDQNSNALTASPRFVGAVESSIPLFGHTLTLAALAQQDETPPDELVKEWTTATETKKGGKFDSQYLTLKAEGPLADKLFYSAFATLETGTTLSFVTGSDNIAVYEYKPVSAVLGGLQANWFAPDFLSAAVTFRALFASGDSDATSPVEGNTKGNSTQFSPVTATVLGTAFNPGLSNLGYYELGGSGLKPMPGWALVTGAKVMGFHRLTTGPVNSPGVLNGGPVWMGEELDAFATWQPYSDMQVTASLGAFLPTAGTFATSTTGSSFQYAISTGVNLSL